MISFQLWRTVNSTLAYCGFTCVVTVISALAYCYFGSGVLMSDHVSAPMSRILACYRFRAVMGLLALRDTPCITVLLLLHSRMRYTSSIGLHFKRIMYHYITRRHCVTQNV